MSITATPVTVAELQAALRAVWAGEFRTRGRAVTRSRPPHLKAGGTLSGLVVMVVGCHGGAGASTLALAVAEAVQARNARA
jgi:Flp pilus assembly CpaE family ATPase